MAVWLFPDGAQSSCPTAITSSQLTAVLQSTASFGAIAAAQQMGGLITDNGNPNYNPQSPLATPFEYVFITGNNLGTNTLTWTRGQAGTTPKNFFAGAQVTGVLLGEALAANTGAFARFDQPNLGIIQAQGFQAGGPSNNFGQFTAVGRFLGVLTVAGPPTGLANTYSTGDWGFDNQGVLWICTGGGAPGTWITPLANGHLKVFGSTPTLGALQAGVATQTIVGTDFCHVVTLTTTASPPGPAALLFSITFATAFASIPGVVVTENGTGVVWAATASNSVSGYNVFHGGTAAGAVALSASTTYVYACMAVGAKS